MCGEDRDREYTLPSYFLRRIRCLHFLVGSYRVPPTELKDTKRDEPDGEDVKAWILTMETTQYLPPFRMNGICVDR